MPDIVSPGIVGSADRRRLPEWLVVALAAVGLAIVMTWPLAPRLSKIARLDSTDAMYAMWNVAWVARTLTSEPSRIFDANIFHPHTRTLAFSESNLLTGAFGIPAWLVTRDVYATYNSVTLIGFILAFVCAYALARRLTGSRLGASVAAIGFAFCPYVYARFPHIQLQMTFGMPLSLLALHWMVDRPSWRRGIALGLALAAQGLTCAYYGILAGLSVGAGIIFYAVARRQWRERSYWAAAAVALVTCLALVVPVFVPYLSIQQAGFERSLDEARSYAYGWASWLASPAKLHAWMLPWLREHGWRGGVLFPGFVTTLAGLAGLALALSRAGLPARGRETAVFYALLGAFALWLSFGPGAGLYTVVYYAVPLFRLLRAPERFGIAVTLVLAIGSAFFVAWLSNRFRARVSRAAAGGGAAVLLALSVADGWIAPLRFRQALPVPRAYTLLARLEPGVVAEFPFFAESFDMHRHAQYMFFSTYHWRPLINGYSDHIPQDFLDSVRPLSNFPAPQAFPILQARGVRYVVVRLNWFHSGRLPYVQQGLRHYTAQGVLRFLDRDTRVDREGRMIHDVVLYEILRYPPANR